MKAGQKRRILRVAKFARAAAFTLVELLMVVAVIAVLASLFTTGISKARSSADSAACKSNLRQIGVSLHLYLADFDCYPPCRGADFDLPWPDAMFRYTGVPWPARDTPRPSSGFNTRPTKQRDLYGCPGYDRLRGFYNLVKFRNNWEISGSYGYKIAGSGYWEQFGLGALELSRNTRPVKESDVVFPSEMIAFGDSLLIPSGPVYGPGYLFVGGPPGWNRLEPRFETKTFVEKRHSARWNILFVDGHIEDFKTKSLFSTNVGILKRWNRDHQPHMPDPG